MSSMHVQKMYTDIEGLITKHRVSADHLEMLFNDADGYVSHDAPPAQQPFPNPFLIYAINALTDDIEFELETVFNELRTVFKTANKVDIIKTFIDNAKAAPSL